MRLPVIVPVLPCIGLVSAVVHELIVGTFQTNSLYTLAFDDESLALSLVKNTSTPAASSWIALSYDKKSLYGTSFNSALPSFVSYSLATARDITHTGTLAAGGNCTGRAIYVAASTTKPHAVYGSFFGSSAGCGAVMSVDESGALEATVQNFTYTSSSGVHGVALSPDSKFLYSADDSGNSLWTHSVDASTGEVTYVDKLSGPSTASDPRHVAVHLNGEYLYVVLEGSSQIAQYAVDASTGVPSFVEVYFLIRDGENATNFWADEVALSYSGNYLWATNRARNSSATGYISAFSLRSNGTIEEQLFLTPTNGTGGSANSVTPSGFSDRFVALTDSSVGFVEIWGLADDAKSSSIVAHLDLADGGCCANAVWYS